MKTQKEMLALVDESVAFYAADPRNRRSVQGVGVCVYLNESKQTRCAIGRILTSEELTIAHEFETDCNGVTGVRGDIWEEFPDDSPIKEWDRNFLERLQTLHDSSSNWLHNGLSADGRETVAQLRADILEGKFI